MAKVQVTQDPTFLIPEATSPWKKLQSGPLDFLNQILNGGGYYSCGIEKTSDWGWASVVQGRKPYNWGGNDSITPFPVYGKQLFLEVNYNHDGGRFDNPTESKINVSVDMWYEFRNDPNPPTPRYIGIHPSLHRHNRWAPNAIEEFEEQNRVLYQTFQNSHYNAIHVISSMPKPYLNNPFHVALNPIIQLALQAFNLQDHYQYLYLLSVEAMTEVYRAYLGGTFWKVLVYYVQ